jgi:acetyltransferase-like isoleucine patch superfamily enzyme
MSWGCSAVADHPPLSRAILAVASALAFVALLPLLLLHRLRFIPAYTRFVASSSLLALVPGHAGLLLRRVWYGCTLARCGRGLGVDWLAVIRDERSEVGDHVWIGSGSVIGWCVLHDDVVTGDHVVVLSGGRQHDLERTDRPMRLQSGGKEQTSVGPDAWIGTRAVIMARVPRGCVVGAGAVVTRVAEEDSVLAGVPARVLRRRGVAGAARNGDSAGAH